MIEAILIIIYQQVGQFLLHQKFLP